MTEFIAALDVGSTKICALVARIEENDGQASLRLEGAGVSPSRGIVKGMVANVPQASEAIAQALEDAEIAAEWPIRNVYVGISGKHISTLTSRGVVPISRSGQGVTQHDVVRALDSARTTAALPAGRDIIHAMPRRFSVGEQQGIHDPIGMHGDRLEVESQMVAGASAAITNLVKCVQSYGVGVESLVLEPLASGEAVLTPAERELGVVVVDIGGGTMDMAIFLEDGLWHTVIREVGGELFTKDVAVVLHTPVETAEELKIRHGHLLAERIPEEETITISGFGSRNSVVVPRRMLARILAARAEETLELVLTEIKRSGFDGLLPAGMVVCGGSAQLPGLVSMSQDFLQAPVRIGTPNGISGMTRGLASPAFATGIGLLKWGFEHRRSNSHEGRDSESSMGRVSQWLRNLLPG